MGIKARKRTAREPRANLPTFVPSVNPALVPRSPDVDELRLLSQILRVLSGSLFHPLMGFPPEEEDADYYWEYDVQELLEKAKAQGKEGVEAVCDLVEMSPEFLASKAIIDRIWLWKTWRLLAKVELPAKDDFRLLVEEQAAKAEDALGDLAAAVRAVPNINRSYRPPRRYVDFLEKTRKRVARARKEIEVLRPAKGVVFTIRKGDRDRLTEETGLHESSIKALALLTKKPAEVVADEMSRAFSKSVAASSLRRETAALLRQRRLIDECVSDDP